MSRGQELVWRLLRTQGRDAKRDLNPPERTRGLAREARLEPAADVDRGLGVGLGEQDREPVAADPADEIVGARRLRDQPPELDQDPVAGGIAVLGVERAEALDIDRDQAERMLVAMRPLDVGPELGSKCA